MACGHGTVEDMSTSPAQGQRHNTGGAADPGAIDHLVFTTGEPLALMNLATLDPDRAREPFNLRHFGVLWAAHAAAPRLCTFTLQPRRRWSLT